MWAVDWITAIGYPTLQKSAADDERTYLAPPTKHFPNFIAGTIHHIHKVTRRAIRHFELARV